VCGVVRERKKKKKKMEQMELEGSCSALKKVGSCDAIGKRGDRQPLASASNQRRESRVVPFSKTP
jgi:hypothetical protein